METTAWLAKYPLGGLMEPPAPALVVNKNCVVNVAVYVVAVAGAVTVIDDPAATVQVVNTYCVPVPCVAATRVCWVPGVHG